MQRWLDGISSDLSTLENDAAPAGWKCLWNRYAVNYYVINQRTFPNYKMQCFGFFKCLFHGQFNSLIKNHSFREKTNLWEHFKCLLLKRTMKLLYSPNLLFKPVLFCENCQWCIFRKEFQIGKVKTYVIRCKSFFISSIYD